MKTLLILTLILLVIGIIPVHAATKTSPIVISNINELLYCRVHNLGTTTVQVTMELHGLSGDIYGQTTDDIAPGTNWVLEPPGNGSFDGYCVFKYQGKSDVRGYIARIDVQLYHDNLILEAH
jgi:hypothetical protein